MEDWKSTVESWLLECSEAVGNGNQSSSNAVNALVKSAEADHLPPEQCEQLLAVCSLQQEKLLLSLCTLFEEKNR